MSSFSDLFTSGLPYDQYLAAGTEEQQRRWTQVYDIARLDMFQLQLVASFQRNMKILVHSGEPIEIEANGWYARILQHEIDHLKGTVYIDRMWSRSFTSIDQYTRHWKSKTSAELLTSFHSIGADRSVGR